MKFPRKLEYILLFFFAFLIYRFFLSTDPLVANDWPLLFRESRTFSPFWAMAWDYMGNGGIGGPAFKTIWIDLYANFVYAITNFTQMPWWLSQRVFWIAPFIGISIFSAYKFSEYFLKDSLSRIISVLIYSFNTYILMILGGGQFGVAFSYALAPLVLFVFFKLLDRPTVLNVLVSGLASGILIALDPRIASLIFLVGFFWFVFFARKFPKVKVKAVVSSLIIAGLINSYWILPILMSRGSISGFSNYTSLAGVKFLSFATLSDSISLLHPNWPENIFGKIYFFKPDFLIFPLFAFATLLLKPKKEILFFLGLAVFSVFLAKGTGDPFGQVYLFIFDNVPGFSLFRDSTKFYILIALSYSILIPYFIENLSGKYKHWVAGAFIIFLLFVLKPAWTGELTGIFKPKPIPVDYLLLKSELNGDEAFYRTMWIPQRQKYGYFDPTHPAISAQDFFKTTNHSQILKNLRMKDVQKLLEESSVKYIIVPTDSNGEIFLKDRKYDPLQYKKTVDFLDKMVWFKRAQGFGNLAVYQTRGYRGHFFIPSGGEVQGKFINPTEYSIRTDTLQPGDLVVFSEAYDQGWKMGGVTATPYKSRFNSFFVQNTEDLKVFYSPQLWVGRGLLLSFATAVGVVSLMVFGRLRRKW